jgi:hypothetical protein
VSIAITHIIHHCPLRGGLDESRECRFWQLLGLVTTRSLRGIWCRLTSSFPLRFVCILYLNCRLKCVYCPVVDNLSALCECLVNRTGNKITCGMLRHSGLGNPILFSKQSATSPDFLSRSRSLPSNSGSYCSVTATSKSDMSYDIWTTIAWTILYQYRDREYTVVTARYRWSNVVGLSSAKHLIEMMSLPCPNLSFIAGPEIPARSGDGRW